MLVPILFVAVSCLHAAMGISVENCPDALPRDKYLLTFEDKCYVFRLNERTDFSDALDRCYETGGRLAIVNNKDINEFLHTNLLYTFSKEITAARKNVWIGLTDLAREGQYRWVDGSPMVYENFHSNRGPNRWGIFGILNYDCVAMNPKTGEWYDYLCESPRLAFIYDKRRPFICEYDAHETSGDDSQITTMAATQETTAAAVTTTTTSNDDDNNNDNNNPTTETIQTVSPTEEQTTVIPSNPDTTEDVSTPTVPSDPNTTQEASTPQGSTDGVTNEFTNATITTTQESSMNVTTDAPTEMSSPKTTCPTIVCNINCGLDGYKTDSNDCMLCECNI